MRIGLLTYFWEDNPGQFFQAFATVLALRKVFPEAQVEIPDVRHWAQPWRVISLRDTLTRPWRNIAQHRRGVLYNEARRRDLPICGPTVVTHDPAEAVDEIGKRNYDLLVVGSDTTLFLLGSERVRENLPPLYWLAGLRDVPRVMMAACSHNVRYETLTAIQREVMSRALKAFSFCAVRDPLTLKLLETLGPAEGVPLRVVPDPTFAYEIDSSSARALWARKKFRKARPVCGFHIPWTTPFAARLVERLRRQFDLVQLGGNFPGCRCLQGLGPFEWSGIFSLFDLYVTTGFHASVFCLKQGVPVFTVEGNPARFDPHSGKSKAYFLHEEFGTLDRHYFNPYGPGVTAEGVFEKILANWQSFDSPAAVEHARQLGQRYLDTARDMRRTVAGLIGLGS